MIYRLLCYSDTHGRLPPALVEDGATAWLHGGDVMHGPAAVEPENRDRALSDPCRAPIARWFSTRPIPIYIVRGNHDIADDFGAFRNASDIGGFVRKIAPRLFLAGLGWNGEKYFELPLESDLQPICDQLSRQVKRLVMPSDRLVLLTHYPPRLPGLRPMLQDPKNGGYWYDCVRTLAEELRPVAIVQGHVHEWAGTSQQIELGGQTTTIFHPGMTGGALLVDVETGVAEVEWPAAV